MSECAHVWVANSGRGGTPLFRLNRQLATQPMMHVACAAGCGRRTWFTEAQWDALDRVPGDHTRRRVKRRRRKATKRNGRPQPPADQEVVIRTPRERRIWDQGYRKGRGGAPVTDCPFLSRPGKGGSRAARYRLIWLAGHTEGRGSAGWLDYEEGLDRLEDGAPRSWR